MYVKIYIGAKWDLGTPGEAFVFAHLSCFCRCCSKLAEYHRLAQPAKYRSLFIPKETKIPKIMFPPLKKKKKKKKKLSYMVTFSVSCILFGVKTHIGYNSAMRNLALFKQPAL